MISSKARSRGDWSLHLLNSAVDNDTYATVLNMLAKGVKAATDRIEKAEQEGPDDYADAVVDDETEIIESLLGTTYVLCQAQITAVTHAALRARKQALSDRLPFSAFGDKSHDPRSLGDQFDAQYSKIEVLWALANYFKHREEWNRSIWDNPTGPAEFTVPVLLAARLQKSSTGNLRTGAEALGNPDYSNMTVFEDIVRRWADEVRNVTRQAFGR